MTFKVVENINSKKFVRTLTFKKAYEIFLQQRNSDKKVNLYEFIRYSSGAGHWKYMTGTTNYTIYVSGRAYGRVNDYYQAVGIYFQARRDYPEADIELVDNRSGEIEKKTLTSRRGKSTVFTGEF